MDYRTTKTIKELMERQDTDKYTYKYTEDNRKSENKQQHKENIAYCIKFHNNDNYEVTQKFKENSKLFKYLQHKSPGRFQKHIEHYTLYDIITSIVKIVNREKLYDPENPRIVICDHYMRYTLNIEAFHFIDLIDIILDHMEPNQLQDRNYFHSNYEIPIYVKNKEKYINSLINPSWTKLNAIMVRAEHKSTKIKWYKQYKIDTDLFNMLKEKHFLKENEQTAKYSTILFAFIQYIHMNFNIFKRKKTHKNIYNIGNTPLKILGVNKLHKYQLETMLATKLTEYNPPICE